MKDTIQTSASKFSATRGLRVFSLSALALTASLVTPGRAQELSESVKAQISEVLGVKDTFTPAEQKMSSSLVFARRKALGIDIGPTASALTPVVGASDFVKVEVHGSITKPLKQGIKATGAQLLATNKAMGYLTANTTLDSLATLAGSPGVTFVRAAMPLHTNVGSSNTQGVLTHQAKTVYKTVAGGRGAGVKVGVISDSASQARVNALIASKDLGPNSKVLIPYVSPTGTDLASDEGAAIMEIVQDMAPDATVEFASGFGDFANAIISLQKDGCQVIIDDLGGPEGVFQDDAVALAVNQVTSEGSIYVSSAGNSGNVVHSDAGCWEGDFVNGGVYVPPTGSGSTKIYNVHAFATGQNFNKMTFVGEPYQYLTWSDPLNASTNDYDLFVTDATGATLKGFSVDVQSAASPAFAQELTGSSAAFTGGNYNTQTNGDLFVVTQAVGALTRALHFDVERGNLGNVTGGATYGHNAGANTVCVAATYWNSAFTGAKPFSGKSNPSEVFSSDGPRKIFYNPDGSSITQGNYLFATNGGRTLVKPDVTAADGVSCVTPGFAAFFGTSAAAPHVAGIAAEMISARAAAGKKVLTPAQLQASLQKGCLDNEATGIDATGGYGVLNAPAAVQAALALP